jgi:hypothetical protein
VSASQRRKGAAGQSRAANLLRDRDYVVDPLSCGIKREDIIATSPLGHRMSVEVKNCALIDLKRFRRQAMEQAKKRKLDWMLIVKLPGTRSWLVQRRDMLDGTILSDVWDEKYELCETKR